MNYKRLLVRLFIFLFCYFGLNVGLTHKPFRKAVTEIYSSIQEPIFNAFHDEIRGDFSFHTHDKDGNQDLRLDGFHATKRIEYTIYLDIRSIVFLPLFLFLSLVVVSPISILRKLIGGIGGLVLFCCLISSYYSHDLLILFAEGQYAPSTLYEKFSKYMNKAWYSEGYLLLMIAMWFLVLLLPNPFQRFLSMTQN